MPPRNDLQYTAMGAQNIGYVPNPIVYPAVNGSNTHQQPRYYPQPQQQIDQNPQPQQQEQPQQMATVRSERIWVEGEGAGKAYIVAKNTEQVLWDSEAPVIYIKTVDAYGRPSTLTLDYTIRNPQPEATDSNQALREEMAEMREQIRQLTAAVSAQNQNQQRNYNNKSYKKGADE